VASWTTLNFHNVSTTSSKMDLFGNATITQNGQQQIKTFNMTNVDFPTDRDTLIFLKNGGHDNLTIYAGPTGITFPILPGMTIDLTRAWDLHDKPVIRTSLGTFSGYRYHTAIKSIALPTGDNLDLDFYASYEMNTGALMAGEIWATLNGSSAQIVTTQIREANLFPTQNPSRCLIATATYGSDLAPQVQFLRDFRDQKIDTTFAGSNFMAAFNLWYYSFSPSAASLISPSQNYRSIMQLLLYPLILILQASAALFDALSFQPEAAAYISGIAASGMIGIFYLWIPSILISRRYRSAMKRCLKLLLVVLCSSTVILVISEVLANPWLAELGSAAVILSNLLLFGGLLSIVPEGNSVVRWFSRKIHFHS